MKYTLVFVSNIISNSINLNPLCALHCFIVGCLQTLISLAYRNEAQKKSSYDCNCNNK